MGSKRLYCKYIVPIINQYIKENNIKEFYDVFCGGANLADKINCENVICNDLSPTLIALHRAAQEDFEKIKKTCTREDWDEAYKEYKKIIPKVFNLDMESAQELVKMPLHDIGTIEWYASYSTGGFHKGFINQHSRNNNGRNDYLNHYNNHLKQSKTENYQKIKFIQGSYTKLDVPPNALIYCDSPYRNSASYQINKNFNFTEYYNWLREKSKTNPIFISEQQMPDDFQVIWKKDDVVRTISLNNDKKGCEKLYFIDNRNK